MLKTRVTVDEYLAITDGDPRRSELIDGEIVYMNEPRADHARIQALLGARLVAWCEETHRATVFGPTHVRLTETDAYGPDLSVAPFETDDRGFLSALPLLCVEIRSPTTWRYDIGRKKSVYEAQGVPELWLVDGFTSEILVFRRSRPAEATYDVALELTSEDTLASPQLPGFALALAELFRS